MNVRLFVTNSYTFLYDFITSLPAGIGYVKSVKAEPTLSATQMYSIKNLAFDNIWF